MTRKIKTLRSTRRSSVPPIKGYYLVICFFVFKKALYSFAMTTVICFDEKEPSSNTGHDEDNISSMTNVVGEDLFFSNSSTNCSTQIWQLAQPTPVEPLSWKLKNEKELKLITTVRIIKGEMPERRPERTLVNLEDTYLGACLGSGTTDQAGCDPQKGGLNVLQRMALISTHKKEDGTRRDVRRSGTLALKSAVVGTGCISSYALILERKVRQERMGPLRRKV